MGQDFSRWVDSNGFVARRSRILYVATPKVACTAIRAALISLEEESSSGATDPHRFRGHSSPRLRELSTAESEAVLASKEWIRFCVTRRPYERFLSAWLNKIFLGRSDTLTAPYAQALHRTSDVGGLFREFVRGFDPESLLYSGDEHFVPQVQLLKPQNTPYTHVLDLSELESFCSWVRSSDTARSGFNVSGRMNVSLKVPLRAMYDSVTAEIVEVCYAEDFAKFGYEREEFGEQADEFLLSMSELALVENLSEIGALLLKYRDLSLLAERRTGGRYGLSELGRALGRRARLSPRPSAK